MLSPVRNESLHVPIATLLTAALHRDHLCGLLAGRSLYDTAGIQNEMPFEESSWNLDDRVGILGQARELIFLTCGLGARMATVRHLEF